MAKRTPRNAYSPEFAEAFCVHIAEGGTIKAFCALPGSPCRQTVFRWLDTHPDFAAHYKLALQWRADQMGEELLELADGPGDPRVVRQQLSARMWMMSRQAPKRYGCKAALDQSAQVKSPPQILVVAASRGGRASGAA